MTDREARSCADGTLLKKEGLISRQKCLGDYELLWKKGSADLIVLLTNLLSWKQFLKFYPIEYLLLNAVSRRSRKHPDMHDRAK